MTHHTLSSLTRPAVREGESPDQAELDRLAVAQVEAMLHDGGYAEAEPQLEQLLAIARLDAPSASLPALRARVLMEGSDETGATQLLADLVAAALTAIHSDHTEADAALYLRAQVQRAVERAEIRIGSRARPALQFRCSHPGCIRIAWWNVEAWCAADGRLYGRILGDQASCQHHVAEVGDRLRDTHHGRVAAISTPVLPGHPDYPHDMPARVAR